MGCTPARLRPEGEAGVREALHGSASFFKLGSFFLSFFFIVNNKNFILIIAVVVFSLRMYGQRSIKCTFILGSETWLRPENF